MADYDHTAGEHLHTAPTHPLGRPFWMLAGVAHREQAIAELAGMLLGIHTLSRVLANSEAFRVQNEASQPMSFQPVPLDALATEGLFAALYFLSDQAQGKTAEWLELQAREPRGV